MNWLKHINSPFDPRLGITVEYIETGNDGDVCNSLVTYELINTSKSEQLYCIDIGVDEGWWSFFVNKYSPVSVYIDSFEPNPTSYQSLLPYLEKFQNIHLHNCAISNKEGFIPFECTGGQSNSRNISSSLQVPSKRIDEYIQNKHVDLIKIDTEGHDLIILETLYPYLESIDSIVFEFTVYWYDNNKEDAIKKSYDVLTKLNQVYPYMYSLSRRGNPYVIQLKTYEDILKFISHCWNTNFQTDIVVTKRELTIVPVKSYT